MLVERQELLVEPDEEVVVCESSVQGKKTLQVPEANNQGLELLRRMRHTLVSSCSVNAAVQALINITNDLPEDQRHQVIQFCVSCAGTGLVSDIRWYLVGLIKELCLVFPQFVEAIELLFEQNYRDSFRASVSRIDGLASLYAYLLYESVLRWNILRVLKLTEEDACSEQRLFIQYFLIELNGKFGFHGTLAAKLKEPGICEHVQGLFPVDSLEHAVFASCFYEAMGLNCLRDSLEVEIDRMEKEENKQGESNFHLEEKRTMTEKLRTAWEEGYPIGFQQGILAGRQKGMLQGKIDVINRMISLNCPHEKIAEVVGADLATFMNAHCCAICALE